MSEIEITGVFENVLGMIYSAKQKAEYQVNSTIIDLYWSIGEYVSKQIDVNGWGKSTVKALSEYILSKEPGIRGYSSQNIWRMKQFYETYKDKPELSKLLRENTWSNNLHIISKTKSYEEKEFYLKLASKEKYKAKELARQIDSGYYERLLLSNGKAPSAIESKDMTGVLRDMYMLEFLDLPEPYKEYDLKKAILKNMKKFLLEFGRDFIFIDEEYHVQVGNNDYYEIYSVQLSDMEKAKLMIDNGEAYLTYTSLSDKSEKSTIGNVETDNSEADSSDSADSTDASDLTDSSSGITDTSSDSSDGSYDNSDDGSYDNSDDGSYDSSNDGSYDGSDDGSYDNSSDDGNYDSSDDSGDYVDDSSNSGSGDDSLDNSTDTDDSGDGEIVWDDNGDWSEE